MSQNIWFTSDNHFYHHNILKKYCPNTRQGDTVEEMNELMIQRWQEDVNEKDIVYIVGDFSFGNAEQTEAVLDRLPGFKILIIGNHEKVIVGGRKGTTINRWKYFQVVTDYHKFSLKNSDSKKKETFVLFHYPMVEWDGMFNGSYHLFGHVHGKVSHPGRAMDVGIDTRPNKDMTLWSLEEVRATLKDKPIVRVENLYEN